QRLDAFQDPVVDANRRPKPCPPVHHPVTNRLDWIFLPPLWGRVRMGGPDPQLCQQRPNGSFEPFLASGIHPERDFVFRDRGEIDGVDKAALERTRAGVQDEDAHAILFLPPPRESRTLFPPPPRESRTLFPPPPRESRTLFPPPLGEGRVGALSTARSSRARPARPRRGRVCTAGAATARPPCAAGRGRRATPAPERGR